MTYWIGVLFLIIGLAGLILSILWMLLYAESKTTGARRQRHQCRRIQLERPEVGKHRNNHYHQATTNCRHQPISCQQRLRNAKNQ